jgi:hypothetical protein
MSAQDVDTIRTAYEKFAVHDAAAVLAKLEHVFDMRDGKVVRFENKPDDAEAWTAGWTS